jgi:DNA-binding NarL/FixJ family response regulator
VAERIAEERGDAFHQPERAVYEGMVSGLGAALGEATFAAERVAGRDWPSDAAVAAALALEPPTHDAPARASGNAAGLTGREAEVIRLVARGWTNERIADELFLSPRTVQTHLTNAFRKMEVDNRTEAVRFAVESGIVTSRD